MSDNESSKTLIFVSHAGADIRMVRRVRNYLEEKNTIPLLFHLIALTDAEEFWPLIEREILARNFFLYCESAAARGSPWVQRERRAVELAREKRPKRIGHIRVDQADFDTERLDRFLADIKVYPIFEQDDAQAVAPFLAALREAGFEILGGGPSHDPAKLISNIRASQYGGWVVFFPSQDPSWTRTHRDSLRKDLTNYLQAPQLPKLRMVDLGNRLRHRTRAIDGASLNAPAALVNALLAQPE